MIKTEYQSEAVEGVSPQPRERDHIKVGGEPENGAHVCDRQLRENCGVMAAFIYVVSKTEIFTVMKAML